MSKNEQGRNKRVGGEVNNMIPLMRYSRLDLKCGMLIVKLCCYKIEL